MNIHMKRVVKVAIFGSLLCIMLYVITIAFLPKIPDFYQEDDWNVVFFGTSMSYCSFNPKIFDEYDMKTYNRGRPQQPINYTYYYIKDALETSNIDVVVLETFALTYWEGSNLYTDEGVRDSTLNDMRYSRTKYEAISDCVPKEQQMGYLFPLDKYHSNWEYLNCQSPFALFENIRNPYYKEESDRGFYGWNAVMESEYLAEEALNSEIRGDIFLFNMKYLEMIYRECQERGIPLVLTRVPLPCDIDIVEKMNTIQDWADTHNIPFINFMKLTDEINMDWKQDSLDGGSHLNIFGAEKVSRYLAKFLKENYFNY